MSTNNQNSTAMKNTNITTTVSSFPLAESEYWAYASNTVNGCVGKHFKGFFTKEEAQDLTAEVVTRMWDNRATFDPEKGNLSQWVWTITRNVVHTAAKKKSNRQPISYELKDGEYSDSTSYTQEAFVDFYSSSDFVVRDAIDDYMHKLDPKDKHNKKCVEKSEKEKKVLRWLIMGYKADEIAEMLGTSANAVYVLTHHIRKKLSE